MRRTPLLGGLICLCVLLGGSACGGQDKETEADVTDDIADTLLNSGDGYSPEQADCHAEIIVEEVGFEALKDLDLSADEAPEEMQDDISAALIRATEECDLSGTSG